MPRKKFVNHIDHVVWISKPENIEANVAELEKLAGASLERFERKDMGFVMYLDWSAGLEVVTPMATPTEFNQMLHHRLETQGEGIMAVVFGVRDLERHKARLEALGYQPGPPMDDHVDSPWHHKISLAERIGGEVMNSAFILGDIDYDEGMIQFEGA